jgi:hypothetical protein
MKENLNHYKKLSISPEGKYLCIDFGAYFSVWSLEEGVPLSIIDLENTDHLIDFFSEDKLIVMYSDRYSIFDVTTGVLSPEIMTIMGKPAFFSMYSNTVTRSGMVICEANRITWLKTNDFMEFETAATIKMKSEDFSVRAPFVFSNDHKLLSFHLHPSAGVSTMGIWNTETDDVIVGTNFMHSSDVQQFSPDGSRIAIGSYNSIGLYSSETLEFTGIVEEQNKIEGFPVMQIKYSFIDDDIMLHGSMFNIAISQISTNKAVKKFETYNSPCISMAVSPHRDFFLVDQCGIISIYSVNLETPVFRIFDLPDHGWLVWDDQGRYKQSGFLKKTLNNTTSFLKKNK